MNDPIESDIDGIVTDVITEVLCIVEYAVYGTTPDDEVRGNLPSEATNLMVDRFAENLKERLVVFTTKMLSSIHNPIFGKSIKSSGSIAVPTS